MFELNIELGDGSNLPLSVPETAREITLSQYLSFTYKQVELEDFWHQISLTIEKDLKKGEDFVEKNQAKLLLMQCECISTFFDIPMQKVLGLPSSKKKVTVKDLIGADYETSTITLQHIFSLINRACNTYKPCVGVVDLEAFVMDERFELAKEDVDIRTEVTFTYKGQDFRIPHFYAQNSATLTVGQMVELMEVRRLFQEVIEKTKKSEEDENLEEKVKVPKKRDMNKYFTELVYTTAILSRKEGEEFPIDLAEIDGYIEQRVKLFQDVPMDIAFDCAFFLTFFLTE